MSHLLLTCILVPDQDLYLAPPLPHTHTHGQAQDPTPPGDCRSIPQWLSLYHCHFREPHDWGC